MANKKEHVHVGHPIRQRGTSAHTREELQGDKDATALLNGTFKELNHDDEDHVRFNSSAFKPLHEYGDLKGTQAIIVAPESFSGTDYDQTFLQGIDV